MEHLSTQKRVARPRNSLYNNIRYDRVAALLLIASGTVYFGGWLLLLKIILVPPVVGISLLGLLWCLLKSDKIYDIINFSYKKVTFPAHLSKCRDIHSRLFRYFPNIHPKLNSLLSTFVNNYSILFSSKTK